MPLDAVDLSHVSILYTQGDMAAITPIYDYNFQVLASKPQLSLLLLPPPPPPLSICTIPQLLLSANTVRCSMRRIRDDKSAKRKRH